MVRFSRRRRFGRRRPRRRAARPRTLLRKSRRLRKVAIRKIQRKKNRKNKKVKKNIWGYMDATHMDAAYNTTSVQNLGSSGTTHGLGRWDDVKNIFFQVRQLDDLIFAQQTGLTANAQLKANRHNLKIQCQGKATYTLASNNTVGGIYAQIYICRPRQAITSAGIGRNNDTTPGPIVANNYNSRSLWDYNDALNMTLSGAGPYVTDNVNQAKPTVASTDNWTTPFMVPEFTRNYKVLKVHKVFLPPNGNFMFTMKLPITTLTRELYEASQTAVGNVVYHPKFARCVFIRFHGSPCDDSTTETLVNFGAASINCIIDKKYEFSYGSSPQFFTVRGTDVLGTVTQATAPGNADQVIGENT